MDTKEKRRRRSSGASDGRRRTGEANKYSASRRRAGAEPQSARNRRSRRTAGTGTMESRRSSTRVRRRQERVVRPPREEIPAVSYTMPKPFSPGAFVWKLVSVAAIVAALVMCLSVFFRVEEVVVSGADKYTPWMVKEASGLEYGDSLLSVSDARVSGNIISALPYVKNVRVGIKLPGTVHIEITELETTYAIEARDGSWWLIAADGRVVEQIEPSAASGYTRILGVQADAPRTDQQVRAAEEAPAQTEAPVQTGEDDGVTLPTVNQITGRDRLDAVLTILQNLEDNGVIGKIATIDVSNLNDITMEYDQRLTVVLGTADRLAYKIEYMALAIAQIEDYQTGELDVSFKYSDKALVNPEV